MKVKIYTLTLMSVLIVSAFNADATQNVSISDVRLENHFFNPTAGDRAQIFFQLSLDAEVDLTIFDADGHLIRVISRKRHCFKGTNTVFWDGRDDHGNIVGDDVYNFTIDAKDTHGFTAVYDPTSFSGGEEIQVQVVDGSEGMSYHLPKDARVRIRIGIHKGALLKTLIDWAPRKAGPNNEVWDGKDDGNTLDVRNRNYIVIAEAFALPENSLITTGSGVDLLAYKLASIQKALSPGIQYNLSLEDRKRLFLKNDRIKARAINQGSHLHYRMVRTTDRAPSFHIKVNNPIKIGLDQIPTVSDEVSMAIIFDENTALVLANQRYEVVVFIDYQFFMEDEQGYHPYNFYLDSRQLTNGRHVITFNVSALTDQVGSGSVIINVQNE